MRIAFDAGPLYGHRTGVGVATAGMYDALARRDDVQLAPYLVSGRATPKPGHCRLPIPGIVASHVWAHSGWPSAQRWLGDVAVVHGTNYTAPPSRHPTVISVYDCWFLRHPERASPVIRRAGLQLRRAVQRGATVHVTSASTAAAAAELLGTERIQMIHLGLPEAVSGAPSEAPSGRIAVLDGRRLIVAIGTEERRKGYPDLIAAFDRLIGDDVDVDLVIAGAPGDDSTKIDAAVAKSSPAATGRIHRLGTVDAATKSWLLSNAALLAYPSLDEGFGFPILEAQQAGVAVVARAVGSIPEIAGPGAHLVADDDFARRFAVGCATLLADNCAKNRLIEAGTSNLSRFSWDDTASELVALYHRLS